VGHWIRGRAVLEDCDEEFNLVLEEPAEMSGVEGFTECRDTTCDIRVRVEEYQRCNRSLRRMPF
jgi:hypothetical protein